MSCCRRKNETEPCFNNICCANNDDIDMKKHVVFNPGIHFCFCRNNEKCFVPTDCSSFASTNPAPNTCLEPCQCAEEIMWNCNTPPKPSCKWVNNFFELRRQWSNHARRQNCKCCNCKLR
ncbi:uncharacterized protein LOC117610652 [Osmia lignaria lignaria]|uniref:uncharacterized protein LOC117610652 n=1 Tax=Osmia lignaria lignaria TaxID=1437193 RepID=UPI001478A984|nr:uncharacterized protein LOC117610652 [Osmia lignaria]